MVYAGMVVNEDECIGGAKTADPSLAIFKLITVDAVEKEICRPPLVIVKLDAKVVPPRNVCVELSWAIPVSPPPSPKNDAAVTLDADLIKPPEPRNVKLLAADKKTSDEKETLCPLPIIASTAILSTATAAWTESGNTKLNPAIITFNLLDLLGKKDVAAEFFRRLVNAVNERRGESIKIGNGDTVGVRAGRGRVKEITKCDGA